MAQWLVWLWAEHGKSIWLYGVWALSAVARVLLELWFVRRGWR